MRETVTLIPSTTMDLFDHAANERLQECAPLAERMRPLSLDEVVGQVKSHQIRESIKIGHIMQEILLQMDRLEFEHRVEAVDLSDNMNFLFGKH